MPVSFWDNGGFKLDVVVSTVASSSSMDRAAACRCGRRRLFRLLVTDAVKFCKLLL